MRPAADGDQRSQWRGNTAANQDTVGQLGKHNPPRPAIPESGTRSIAVSAERRLASRSVACADPTARGHRRDMADDPTRSIIEACPERRRWGKATRANPPPDRRDAQGAALKSFHKCSRHREWRLFALPNSHSNSSRLSMALRPIDATFVNYK